MFCLCLLTAFSCIFRIFLVSLPKEFLKKGKRLRIYTLPFIVKVLTFAP